MDIGHQRFFLLLFGVCLLTHIVICARERKQIKEGHYNFPALKKYDINWNAIQSKAGPPPNNINKVLKNAFKKLLCFVVLTVIPFSIYYVTSSDSFNHNTKEYTSSFTDTSYWGFISTRILKIDNNIRNWFSQNLTPAIQNLWIKANNLINSKNQEPKPLVVVPNRLTTFIVYTGPTMVASKELIVISSNYIALVILFTIALSLGALFYWKRQVFVEHIQEKNGNRRKARMKRRKSR